MTLDVFPQTHTVHQQPQTEPHHLKETAVEGMIVRWVESVLKVRGEANESGA